MVVFLVEKLERSKQMFEKDDTGLASPLAAAGGSSPTLAPSAERNPI